MKQKNHLFSKKILKAGLAVFLLSFCAEGLGTPVSSYNVNDFWLTPRQSSWMVKRGKNPYNLLTLTPDQFNRAGDLPEQFSRENRERRADRLKERYDQIMNGDLLTSNEKRHFRNPEQLAVRLLAEWSPLVNSLGTGDKPISESNPGAWEYATFYGGHGGISNPPASHRPKTSVYGKNAGIYPPGFIARRLKEQGKSPVIISRPSPPDPTPDTDPQTTPDLVQPYKLWPDQKAAVEHRLRALESAVSEDRFKRIEDRLNQCQCAQGGGSTGQR